MSTDENIAPPVTPEVSDASGPMEVPDASGPVPADPPQAQAAEPVRPRAGMPAAAMLAVTLLAGAAAGFGGGYLAYRTIPGSGEAAVSGGETRKIELVDSTEEIVAAAAEVAMPSVVNIDVTSQQTSTSGLPGDHPDVPIQGEGSGVAYKSAPDGGTYIITNNHVVENGTSIIVTDSTGEQYEAELIGADAESDIAVVLIAGELPLIEIGDSESLVVGQTVIAIGSPFGLEQSVTAGVVSALHRALTDFGGSSGQYPYVDSIQTDASINPGNSGGALVDRTGKLVGIPSAIYTDTGVADGVGLAIPVSRAITAADELIEKGSVDTPFLGILGQTVTLAFAEEEGLPVTEGAYVSELTTDSEAEKAGLEPGDVIVALDKARIRTMDDLVLAVRRRAVGDEVTLSVWRDGKQIDIDMTVGIKPADLGLDD
jgi:S1-C subfamily serine protease